MSRLFVTSDTHWGHNNIITYSNRPFESVHEMNTALTDNWNSMVRPQDNVYHLGDFAFQDKEVAIQTLKRLNGKKHLILGNHDKVITKNREEFLGTNLFHSIQDYLCISFNGQDIVLFHYPLRTWDKAHRGSWSLFGHVHNKLAPYRKSVDVGVDSTWITGVAEYRPFSFEEIKVFMDKQEQETIG